MVPLENLGAFVLASIVLIVIPGPSVLFVIGRSLALGVGVRYDVDVYPAPTLQTPVFVHRVAPLTSGSVRFRYQTDDGLLMLDAYGEVAPHWTSDNTWAVLANGSARLDRTLIAINDQPIGAYAEVGYRYLPEGAGAPAGPISRSSWVVHSPGR